MKKKQKLLTIETLQLAAFLACDSDMTKYQQIVAKAKTIVTKYHISQLLDTLKIKMNKENNKDERN